MCASTVGLGGRNVLSPRAAENQRLTQTIAQIHADSRGTYGAPRVHMELRLGQQTLISRKRVARLMRLAGLKGVYRRRAWGCTKRDPDATPNPDLVRRQFTVDGPDVLWVSDITEHPTEEGKLYLATVIDAYSRRAIGWSIADHMRSELVVDALQMAIWRRRPPAGKTICHSDHGAQYTSWAFGRRLRGAGLLGSMGAVGDCFDNSLAESFFGTLQMELLDRQKWSTRQELALAIFEYLECEFDYFLIACGASYADIQQLLVWTKAKVVNIAGAMESDDHSRRRELGRASSEWHSPTGVPLTELADRQGWTRKEGEMRVSPTPAWARSRLRHGASKDERAKELRLGRIAPARRTRIDVAVKELMDELQSGDEKRYAIDEIWKSLKGQANLALQPTHEE